MRSAIWTCSVLCVLVGALRSQAEQEKGEIKIAGHVVDSKGEPVSGARIRTGWFFDHGRLRAYGLNGGRPVAPDPNARRGSFQDVITDEVGNFAGYFPARRDRVHLTVFSSDNSDGGSFEWSSDDVRKKVRLVLQPTARVRARLICSQLGLTKVNAIAYLNSVPNKVRMGRFGARTGKLDLRLPVGTFELYMYGGGCTTLRREITIRPEKLDVRLGDIDMPAEYFTLHRGRKLPEWHVTAARGREETTIASFKGKWLLVEFWGFW